MKYNKVGQDFNKSIGIKYPMAIDTPLYPRWIGIVFWGGVAAVFAASIFWFINF